MGVSEWWALLAITAALCVWKYWKQESKCAGPRSFPIVGSSFEAVANRHRFHDWLFDQLRKSLTGTISMTLVGRRTVFTANPDNVEYILKTNFSNFPKGSNLQEKLAELFGTGIVNSDGDVWRRHRKIASFEFSSKKLRLFSTLAFRDGALRLMDILKSAAELENPVDFQDLVLRMMLDSICKVGFGLDVGALSPSLPEVKFGKCFDSATEITTRRTLIGFLWKFKRVLNIGTERILRKDIEEINAFSHHIIKSRQAEILELKAKGSENDKSDLLSRFMTYEGTDGSSYNDKELRDAILNFVIAGRDTTAATLAWFSFMICIHPKVSENIFKEIKEVVGVSEGESHSEFAEKLTYEALGRMYYLHSAISETLRLYPPVPVDVKCAATDCVLPDGTQVSKGASVLYVPYSMGRMKSLWGHDVMEFKPERWLKDGVFQPQSPFKYTAFQAGPRVCMGKDSALLQVKLTFALIVRFVKMELVLDQDIRYGTAAVMQIANGIHVLPVMRV